MVWLRRESGTLHLGGIGQDLVRTVNNTLSVVVLLLLLGDDKLAAMADGERAVSGKNISLPAIS
jgi:hypothetical protein